MASVKASMFFGLVLAITSIAVGKANGQHVDAIQQHIDAGEFGLATTRAEASDDKDNLLGRIAVAQAKVGAASASKATLRRIANPRSLADAATTISHQAAGGATGADFDSLINLITTTVAPNSWDDVGGPGSIAPFEGGVYVDTSGVLRRVAHSRIAEELSLRRAVAAKQLAQNDVRRPSDMRMISLPRLERELQLRAAFGEPPSQAMQHLAGIREIHYVFVYPNTGDLVLAGPAGDWQVDAEGRALSGDPRPVILLDHLVTLLKNADTTRGRFGCSITPKQTNLAATKRFLAKPTGRLKPYQTARWVEKIRETLGLQDIEIHGVDPSSQVARILVEADYHMKLVGMGLQQSVPGIPSYLGSIDSGSIPRSLDVLRWWFTLRPEAVVRNADGDAFALTRQTVRLQSENELITERGERVHTGESSELNQLFANRFTTHYERLAAQYPIYAQLENVFRLALVAALVHDDDVQSKLDWRPEWLVSHFDNVTDDVPREVPSILNYRIIAGQHVVVGVSGGVTANAFASLGQRVAAELRSMESSRDVSRPNDTQRSERWWWD